MWVAAPASQARSEAHRTGRQPRCWSLKPECVCQRPYRRAGKHFFTTDQTAVSKDSRDTQTCVVGLVSPPGVNVYVRRHFRKVGLHPLRHSRRAKWVQAMLAMLYVSTLRGEMGCGGPTWHPRGCARGTSRSADGPDRLCKHERADPKVATALLRLSTPLPPPAIADPSYSGDRGSVVATAAATTAPGAPPRLRRPTRHPHVRSAAARAPGLYMAGALRHGQVPGPGRGWGRGQSWGLAYRVEREGQSAVVNVRRMLLR